VISSQVAKVIIGVKTDLYSRAVCDGYSLVYVILSDSASFSFCLQCSTVQYSTEEVKGLVRILAYSCDIDLASSMLCYMSLLPLSDYHFSHICI
jgi:hypothetical protein